MQKFDIEHLRSWIGREETTSDAISPDLVRKFNATFDLRSDEPRRGDIAPPLIHLCLGQPAVATAALAEDGHPKRGGFLPPVSLPRRMWAGGRMRFHGDLHVGDEAQRASRIADITVREGRTGLLCFVTVEHIIKVDGEVLVEEGQDIVYRDLDQGGPNKRLAPATTGRHIRRVEASPQLLFRYSAITFNGHRIHYDRRYVTEVEGYPGLVVHGPLQATLLLHFAADLRGTTPSRFTFRSVSPLFDDSAVLLHADENGSGLKLWTARENGPVAMMAEAEWGTD